MTYYAEYILLHLVVTEPNVSKISQYVADIGIPTRGVCVETNLACYKNCSDFPRFTICLITTVSLECSQKQMVGVMSGARIIRLLTWLTESAFLNFRSKISTSQQCMVKTQHTPAENETFRVRFCLIIFQYQHIKK